MVDDRTRRPSDLPGDLVREREAFVRSFLKKGFELTEELLVENTGLRGEIARVRDENARLRAAVASSEAIRDLLSRIDALEEEKRAILDASSEHDVRRRVADARFEEIERELNDLANLYVASFQLHTSLSPRRVLRHLLDMCGQLVGARSTIVYVVDDATRRAVPVGWEGLGDTAPSTIAVGEGPIGEACLTGIPAIRERPTPEGLGAPVAVVPLDVEGRPAGAIAIVELLVQKTSWAPVDRELFKLLGAHAGPALIGANLYAAAGSTPLAGFRGLEDNLRRKVASQADGE